MKGNYITNEWLGNTVKVDFYLLKGILENILNYLGFKNRYDFNVAELSDMHPGMSAELNVDRERIGFLGRIHPSLKKDEIYVAEFSLTKLIDKKVKPIKFKEVSKYPEIKKDIAFIVDKEVTASTIMKEIKKAGGRLLTDIDVFDIYTGENVKETEKSIAFSLTFSDSTKTLSDEEVTVVFKNIIDKVCANCNAILRDK